MKLFSTRKSVLIVIGFAFLLSGCSKKKKGEGDVADDITTVQPTDLGGRAIPELPPVYFAYDSFEIDSQSRRALDAHAQWLKSNSGQRVQIEGHCDERGTDEYNVSLGERRASAVKRYLQSKGVSDSQLTTISYGEARPAVMGSNESAWAKNRRAEFVSAN